MNFTVALTGATGNMGKETLSQLYELNCVGKIKILCLPEEKRKGRKLASVYKDKVSVIFGDISDAEACKKLTDGADYVLNLAAVIPPRSDKNPTKSENCNYLGAKTLTDCIAAMPKQPKFIHISTVALYGNRNHLHPWGRVGDPLLPSPYDAYAMSKLRGERYVLDAELQKWAVLRQTAMLHSRMLTDNLSDGLMFHTCYNSFLEWVTAHDSGKLMARIIEEDSEGRAENFWYKCYNIGGGDANRGTGYDTFNGGFEIIGGSTEKFMKPHWNASRNFHGLWFYDGDVLEKMFGYQSQTVEWYWKEILRTHRYYSAAKIIPPSWISKLAIQRLLKDSNSPSEWKRRGDDCRVFAYFGENSELPSDWKDFPLAVRDTVPGAAPYAVLRDITKAELLNHGYDENKPDSELDAEDMRSAAAFRGGKLISANMKKGDLYTKLRWECADGHRFDASPYTVAKAGHWCPECVKDYVWDFDRLAKRNAFFAQVWYDSHDRNENKRYSFDENFNAVMEKTEENQ